MFAGKKVALFAVPGAYTPTCHKQHMAGFVQNYGELKKKSRRGRLHGGQRHVRADGSWAKDSKADGKIQMLADGSAEFAKKVGLDIDLTARGLGVRSRRYSMIVENGVVKSLNIERRPACTTSRAPRAVQPGVVADPIQSLAMSPRQSRRG